ncbi:CCAAT- binding transcription factor component [Mitosporidium daphniae]
MDPSTYESAIAATGMPQPSSQLHSSGHSSSALSNQLMLLQNFWQSQLQAIEHGELDFKNFQLPLARIKKVMKTDEDVKVGRDVYYFSDD